MDGNKIKLIAGIIVCIAFVLGAYFLYSNLQNQKNGELITEAPQSFNDSSSEKDESTEGKRSPAPDFQVTDPEGNTVKLSDFKGTPVVINLWASWCPPCKAEMPVFNEKAKEYEGKIQFMMINLTAQDKLEDAKKFMEEAGYTFPVFYDVNNDAGQKYYTPGIPATFFIDADGNSVAYITGAIDELTLIKGIKMIFDEEK